MQRSRLPGLLERFASISAMTAIGLGILAASPASAAGEQCRSIKSDKGRLACFDRDGSSARSSDAEARPAIDKKAAGAFVDPVDLL
jgi:hypothetical protein